MFETLKIDLVIKGWSNGNFALGAKILYIATY